MNSSGAASARRRTARAGFAAKGVLYAIIGVLAIAVALGEEQSAADQQGALASLAGSTGGKLLLGLLALGLAGYALFRLYEVISGPDGDDGARAKLERAASVVRVAIYAGLCFTAVQILAEGGSSSSGSSADSSTSTVFDLPGGVALVIAAGAILAGVGVFQLHTAISGSFRDDLQLARMDDHEQHVATVAGTAGHAARAVVFALAGAFLIKAGVEHDAKEAVGLDGALQEIAQQAYGTILLAVVALGLFVYGFYSVIEARYGKF